MAFTDQERKTAFRFIVALGFVSLFADMTYEGAHSVIGPLLKDLGASATEVGIIAGLGEMIAASLRYFSGRLVDRTRAYWTITTLGYFLNLVVVPGLAFAGNWQAAALLVVIGGKMRSKPRDWNPPPPSGGARPVSVPAPRCRQHLPLHRRKRYWRSPHSCTRRYPAKPADLPPSTAASH